MSSFAYTVNRGTGWPYTVKRSPVAVKQTAGRGAAGATGNVTLNSILNRYYSQLQTPAQQAKQANQQVNAQIQTALAGMRASTAAEQAGYTKQQARATGFALAQQSLENQYAPQALSDYRQAAQDIQGLGTGLTGAVGAAQQAQANKAAADISALTGGRNTATGLDVPGMQNVAQYTGVTVPSSDLYTQAASAAASARYSTLANADKIHQIATDYAQKWQDAQHQLNLNRQTLEATRPGLYTTASNTLASNARSDMATLVSALTLQNTMANTGSQIDSRSLADTINKALAPVKVAQGKAGVTATTAKTAATKAGTTKTAAQTTGLLPGGILAPNFHWSSPDPKTRTPVSFDPKKYTLDPNDPTYSKLVPLVVPGAAAKAKAEAVKTKAAAAKTQAADLKAHGLVAPGQPAPNYYLPRQGATVAEKIPPHYILGPNAWSIVPDPRNPPPRSAKSGLTTSQVNSIIASRSAAATKLVHGPPYAIVHQPDPYGLGAKVVTYTPALPLPEAKRRLLNRYPTSMRKNPQVVQAVNDALATVGYKT